VRVERYGYIYGHVLNVSVIPGTREGMMRVLKNGSLIDKLMADGPPFEVKVGSSAHRRRAAIGGRPATAPTSRSPMAR
jgi:hypothetical protein